MTIDLTQGEDAGWMSFTIEDEGEMPDGRRRVRINRGRSKHAIVAIETDDAGVPVRAETIDHADGVSDGWLEAAHEWLWTQVLGSDGDG